MKFDMVLIYDWLGGKSIAFALWIFIVGSVLAFLGKLHTEYVALAGALQALIAARSVASDYHERALNGNGDGFGHVKEEEKK
jgi:hypothetical protein